MSKQPEALRIADGIDDRRDWYEFDPSAWCPHAAAELRRLHSLNAELVAELEAQQVYARVLCKAIDAATDFAGTVAGGASWWDDVWAEHYRACDAAREGISKAKEAQQ